MDPGHIRLLRELLEGTDWVGRTRGFAGSLRSAGHRPGGLLAVGTPSVEPWHLTAHLEEEARLAGVPQLAPTLVRHRVPPGAPAHLAVDLSRLTAARRGETVLVVAPDAAGERLLDRVQDARRTGVTVLALHTDDSADSADLRGLAHEALAVAGGADPWLPDALRADGLVVAHDRAVAFETAQHLVSVAAGELPAAVGARRGFRDRLARLIDVVSGPAPSSRGR